MGLKIPRNVKSLLESSKRNIRKPVCKKDVISPEKSLFKKHGDSKDLSVVRDLAMIIVCFCGFLRYDDVSNIKYKDVTINIDYVRIFISKSKSDQYRDGNEVLLSKLDSIA